jgi:hypothetical protein
MQIKLVTASKSSKFKVQSSRVGVVNVAPGDGIVALFMIYGWATGP